MKFSFKQLVHKNSGFIALITFANLLIVSGCTPNDPQSTFGIGGPIARQQADLFILIFWVAVIVFILVEGALVYVLFRYRHKKNDTLPYQSHGNTKLEIIWTIIPAVILAIIAVPTVKGIWDQQSGVPLDSGSPLIVEAIGHQWWFEFRYPDLEISTANELHIPVNRPISFKLQSEDVIHSFWVPKLAGKVDMMPLNDNYMWFIAEEPGMYYGQCAEFCGIAHALMRFRVIAESEIDFENWIDGMHTPPALPRNDSEKNGKTLFTQQCSMCHTIDSYAPGSYAREITSQAERWTSWVNDTENSPKVSAPNLTHFGLRSTIGAGLKEFSTENPDNLIKWIKDPSKIKIGTRMQKHANIYKGGEANLQDEEIEDLANYLLSQKPNIK
jgi:cytochrome c oxidase subunit 2|tara:strand:- start:447 stop:1601 length:1155 start_codon:yes stop_codon:yes gene_type:complete